jgi:hypothetical protein
VQQEDYIIADTGSELTGQMRYSLNSLFHFINVIRFSIHCKTVVPEAFYLNLFISLYVASFDKM